MSKVDGIMRVVDSFVVMKDGQSYGIDVAQEVDCNTLEVVDGGKKYFYRRSHPHAVDIKHSRCLGYSIEEAVESL